jgi:uncharacterized protein (TIGR02391 family)
MAGAHGDRGLDRDEGHLLNVIFERFEKTAEWPLVDQLRYELDQADDDIDVLAIGLRLDPALGRISLSHGDRAFLTIHGIALCSKPNEVLNDLLAAMQLAYRRFRANGVGARIKGQDLEEELGMTPLRARRVFELIASLPGIGGGTGGAAESWFRDITPDITAFKHAESVSDLLAIAPKPRPMTAPTPQRPVERSAHAEFESVVSVGDPLQGLHPEVVARAGPLFADHHYGAAAFEAFKSLELALKERSGLDVSGRELAEKALGGSSPKVVVSRHRGRTGTDEQEGIRFLFMGALQGLRNPSGHELKTLGRQEALEELAVASLLMRWLDTSRAADASSPPTGPAPRERGRGIPGSNSIPARRAAAAPRLVVLRELREMAHRQARTSAVQELELPALARASDISRERLQDSLVDLLAEGLAEPFGATMDRSAELGACRITGDGIREIARLEVDDR